MRILITLALTTVVSGVTLIGLVRMVCMNNAMPPFETQQDTPPSPSPARANNGKETHNYATVRADNLAANYKPRTDGENRPKDITSLRADIAKLARAPKHRTRTS